MDECIDFLGEEKLFSTLDANSGNWQIEMDKKGVDKMGFLTHNGWSEYTKMRFGSKTAPETFQQAMDVILATEKWQYALVYIADTTIFSTTLEERLQHIGRELKLQNIAAKTIELKKCSFLSKTIASMGHIIAPGKLHAATKTTEAIKALQ